MGSLENRIRALEARTTTRAEEDEGPLGQEILRRMTADELRLMESALERALLHSEPGDEGLRFAEEDLPILQRHFELEEEVRNELEAQA